MKIKKVNSNTKIKPKRIKDIKIDQWLNYEIYVSISDIFSKDGTLVSFIANQKFRIIGRRESIISIYCKFDKNHLSYPG